jgi:hypothetical protein
MKRRYSKLRGSMRLMCDTTYEVLAAELELWGLVVALPPPVVAAGVVAAGVVPAGEVAGVLAPADGAGAAEDVPLAQPVVPAITVMVAGVH